jgi:Zn-dependent M28 family amino/carboxypeptidase
MRVAAVAAATTTALVLGPATMATGSDHATGSERLQQKVQVSQILEHLKALQEIADQHGDRASGNPGYEASAEYVEHRLRAAGYQTERQYFPFTYTEILEESVQEVSPTARSFANHVMTGSPSTPEGGVEAALVSPTTITGCNATEWGGVNATGKIALVQRGACTFLQKSQAAGVAGAEAIIVFNNQDGELNGTLGDAPTGAIPSTGITQADGQSLRTEMAAGTVTMDVDLRTLVEERKTFNVLAELQGTGDDVLMLGSHLDSVVGGPGINDNGSGSATILTVAQQLAKMRLDKPEATVRFAWWGAEETGLVGSTYYVNQLKKDPAELDRISTYLNFDMLGSPNFQIGVYDADESTHEAAAPIPPGSMETEDVFTGYFDSIGQPWNDAAFTGRSDYQAFINNGIAAGGLFSGGDGVKTPEQQAMYGGTAGLTFDPNYHTPEDDIANVSLEALDIMSDAVAHATYTIAHDPSVVAP